MARSVLLDDDEQRALRTIVADALRRQSIDWNVDELIDDALERLGQGEIPGDHAEFHAFASGALYAAVEAYVGDQPADALMSDVARMWRLASLHQETLSQPPVEEMSGELDGYTVLVLDDDPMAVRALARALPSYGANVLTAEDVDTAMTLIQQHKPHAVIVDYAMPGESGATFASMMGLVMGDRSPPVICLTGVTPEPRNALFDSVLPKPTHPSLIVAAVAEAILDREDGF